MSKVREWLTGSDESSKLTEEAKTQLKLIMEIAEKQSQIMSEELKTSILNAGQGDNRTVPISKLLHSHIEMRGYISKDAKNIDNAIKESIRSFSSGSKGVVNGLTTLLSPIVTALFGSKSGEESQFRKYFVIVEGSSIVRFDVAGWSRIIEVESLTKFVEQVSCFVLYKSSVNLSQLHFSTFLSMFQDVLSRGYTNDEGRDVKQITKEVEEAKKLYAQYIIFDTQMEAMKKKLKDGDLKDISSVISDLKNPLLPHEDKE